MDTNLVSRAELEAFFASGLESLEDFRTLQATDLMDQEDAPSYLPRPFATAEEEAFASAQRARLQEQVTEKAAVRTLPSAKAKAQHSKKQDAVPKGLSI